MVVFDGYPIEAVSVKVVERTLIIQIPKERFKRSPTVVIFYNKRRQPQVELKMNVSIKKTCDRLEEVPIRMRL